MIKKLIVLFTMLTLLSSCSPVQPVETWLERETNAVIESGTPLLEYEMLEYELPFLKGYNEELKRISSLDDKIQSLNRVIDYFFQIDEERLLFVYENNTYILAVLYCWETGDWQSLTFSQPILTGGSYQITRINQSTFGFSVGNPDKQNELYILEIDDTLYESGPYRLPRNEVLELQEFSLTPDMSLACLIGSDGSSIDLYDWISGLSNEFASLKLTELELSTEAKIKQVHFLSSEMLLFQWQDFHNSESMGYGIYNLKKEEAEISVIKPDNTFYQYGLGCALQWNLDRSMLITTAQAYEFKSAFSTGVLDFSDLGSLLPLHGNVSLFPMVSNLSDEQKQDIPNNFNLLWFNFEQAEDPVYLLSLPRKTISYSVTKTLPQDRSPFIGAADFVNKRIFTLGARELFDDKMILYVIQLSNK